MGERKKEWRVKEREIDKHREGREREREGGRG